MQKKNIVIPKTINSIGKFLKWRSGTSVFVFLNSLNATDILHGCLHVLSTHFTLNFDTKLKIMERSRKNIVRHSVSNVWVELKTYCKSLNMFTFPTCNGRLSAAVERRAMECLGHQRTGTQASTCFQNGVRTKEIEAVSTGIKFFFSSSAE